MTQSEQRPEVADLRVEGGDLEHLERVRRLRSPRRQKTVGVVGSIVVAVLIAVAVFAPSISPYDPGERTGPPFGPPGPEHLLGSNDVGEDILSELIYGTRVSLLVGFTTAISAVAFGTFVGLIAGFYRGWVEGASMRFADVVLVIPFLPLMIVLAAFFGPSVPNLIAIIVVVTWPQTARVVRSRALSLHRRSFVESARALGASNRRLMFGYFLPLLLPLALSQFVLVVPYAILIETTLSFLGLGDPTVETWGSMLFWANSRGAFLTDAWLWWILPPGIAISVTVLAFTYAGYLIENITDPRSRH